MDYGTCYRLNRDYGSKKKNLSGWTCKIKSRLLQVLTGQNAILVNRLTHWRPFDGTRMTVARASASAASNQICHTQNHFLSISALENFTSSALYFLESFRFSLISNRLSNTSEARLKSFARAGGEGAEREEFGHEKTSSAQYYHI